MDWISQLLIFGGLGLMLLGLFGPPLWRFVGRRRLQRRTEARLAEWWEQRHKMFTHPGPLETCRLCQAMMPPNGATERRPPSPTSSERTRGCSERR